MIELGQLGLLQEYMVVLEVIAVLHIQDGDVDLQQ
jgi:hypothetical protein